MPNTDYEQYADLLRKIAWSFHRKTGLDWDDLFGEACLAYVKAVKTFDHDGSQFSTFLYHHVGLHLYKYVYRWRRPNRFKTEHTRTNLTPEAWTAFREALNSLSSEARAIVDMILERPAAYASLKQRTAEKTIHQELERAGWSQRKRRRALLEIKTLLGVPSGPSPARPLS